MSTRASDRAKTSAHSTAAAAARIEKERHREIPAAPAYLTVGATAVWYEVMKAVPSDHFEEGDYRTLAAYCEACALLEDMSTDRDSEEYTVTDDKGNTKVNPFYTLYKSTIANIAALALRLKLAPSTRTKDAAGDKRARRMMAAGRNSERGDLMFQGRNRGEDNGD